MSCPPQGSCLDCRGFVWAFAHVRGGGELGAYWYQAGKLLNKRNTFIDFIACAEHLIKVRRWQNTYMNIGRGTALLPSRAASCLQVSASTCKLA